MVFFTITYIIIIIALFTLIGWGYYKDYKKTPGYFKFTLKNLGKYILLAILAIAIYLIIIYTIF